MAAIVKRFYDYNSFKFIHCLSFSQILKKKVSSINNFLMPIEWNIGNPLMTESWYPELSGVLG